MLCKSLQTHQRRVGRSLRRAHCKGTVVPTREQVTHKPLGAESSISSSKRVSNPSLQKTVLVATDNTTVVAYINKEGGMKSGSLCALLWRILSWCTRQQVTLRARHIPGRLNVIADKLSRLGQTIQTEWSLHPEVCPSCMFKVASATSGPVCHQVQQQTTTVCITGIRPPGLGSGCTQPVLGVPGPIRLPTGSHLGQSGGEAPGLPLQQNNSDCSRVAQHALVLGPGSNVKPDPTVSAQHTQPSVSAIQPGPSQEPVESEPTCLAPRASAIKEQGFSEAVAARIEAPQRRSTRSVYEAKWTIFTKWCLSNQVDFRAPPLKAIADFLLHLFQEKKLQPSSIDGYRSAIADNWAIPPLMSAKMRISLVFWIISIETDLRAGGASPPGTFHWFYISSQRLPLIP